MIITHSYPDVTQWFLDAIQEVLKEKKNVTIGLPGGHSLDGWYTSIITDKDVFRRIDTSKIRWCLVDERCVVPESFDRSDKYVWETFVKPL